MMVFRLKPPNGNKQRTTNISDKNTHRQINTVITLIALPGCWQHATSQREQDVGLRAQQVWEASAGRRGYGYRQNQAYDRTTGPLVGVFLLKFHGNAVDGLIKELCGPTMAGFHGNSMKCSLFPLSMSVTSQSTSCGLKFTTTTPGLNLWKVQINGSHSFCGAFSSGMFKILGFVNIGSLFFLLFFLMFVGPWCCLHGKIVQISS